MPKISELEQKAAIQILLLLLNDGEQKISELVSKIDATQAPIYRAIVRLRDLGLINDKVTEYPIKRLFSLTERGLRVAEKLAEIEKILEGELPAEKQIRTKTRGERALEELHTIQPITKKDQGKTRIEALKDELNDLDKQ